MKSCHLLPGAFSLIYCITSFAGTAVLGDSTFDLSNYTVTTFVSGSPTITLAQSNTVGNPSPSLAATIEFQPFLALPTPQVTAFLVSNLMKYDPTTGGTVLGIDYQMDVTSSISNPILVNEAFAIPVIEQNGEYFVRKDGLFTIPGSFQTMGRSNLAPFGWGRVIDKTFVNFGNDAPDYTKPMSFGLAVTGGLFSPYSASLNYNVWFDNLKYTLYTADPVPSVPEMPTTALLAVGLLVLRRFSKRRLLD